MNPDCFTCLSNNELKALEDALRNGSLTYGVTKPGVEKLINRKSEKVWESISQLVGNGWTPSQLGYLFEQIRIARSEEDRLSHIFDLVITGHASPGQSTRATGAVFQEMTSKAKEEILMASFAVYNGRDIFSPLVQRWNECPTLKIQLFLDIPRSKNDTTVNSALIARYRKRFIGQWPGERLPELYHFLPALESDQSKRASMHAKVVIVDRSEIFISSANFTNAAQSKNIEVGVKISASDAAGRVHNFFQSALKAGQFSAF